MLTIGFIFETVVIATVLTAFVTYNNFSIRKKMNERLGKECKEKMRFFFKHPFLAIVLNLGLFLLVTAIIKLLYKFIFKE